MPHSDAHDDVLCIQRIDESNGKYVLFHCSRHVAILSDTAHCIIEQAEIDGVLKKSPLGTEPTRTTYTFGLDNNYGRFLPERMQQEAYDHHAAWERSLSRPQHRKLKNSATGRYMRQSYRENHSY